MRTVYIALNPAAQYRPLRQPYQQSRPEKADRTITAVPADVTDTTVAETLARGLPPRLWLARTLSWDQLRTAL